MLQLVKSLARDDDDNQLIVSTISKVIQKGNARIILDDARKRSLVTMTQANENTKTTPKQWSVKRGANTPRRTPVATTLAPEPHPLDFGDALDPTTPLQTNIVKSNTAKWNIACPAPVLPNSPAPPHIAQQQQHGVVTSAHDPGPAATNAQIPATPRCTEASLNDLQRDGARSVMAEFKPSA
jgi:hypothetical protein